MPQTTEPLVLGIDLGGTKILTAVVDSAGVILSRDHTITPAAQGPEAVLEAIGASLRRVLAQAGLALERLAGIGIGAPGPSNPETGMLYSSPNLPGWRNVALRDIIERQFGRPSFFINDANAAAFAEYRFGAGRGCRQLIYLTISTGIGGGIIIDGRLYTGASGSAAELGHMTIDDHGPLCNCGNRGCWEVLASGTAMAKSAFQAIAAGRKSTIAEYAAGRPELVTAEHIHAAAVAGDELAVEIIGRGAHYLGVGLVNLINIFNPELIVIGGGVSRMGDMLLEPARTLAANRAFENSYRAVRFEMAALGRNSGVLGAAAMALDKLKH